MMIDLRDIIAVAGLLLTAVGVYLIASWPALLAEVGIIMVVAAVKFRRKL
jgi:hypothetical protein